jgi:hypothetical protein
MKPLSTRYINALTGRDNEHIQDKKVLTGALIYGDKPNFPAILNNGTQLSVLKNELGLDYSASILALMIGDFCSNFNTRFPMSAEQIADFAIELLTDYWTYRLEDFVAFFALAKRGNFGKVYDRIDAAVILTFLGEYNKHRESNLIESQMYFTQHEKGYRDRPEGDGVTGLAGAFSEVKKLAGFNKDQINRLDPGE